MAPPPPPQAPLPPPAGDLDDLLMPNGFDGQPQNDGAVALPSFETGDTNGPMDMAPPGPPEKVPQVWEKPLSIPEIRKSSNNWSLASDAGLLLYLQEFSHKMLTRTSELEKKVDGLVHEAKCTDSRVHNVFNDFLMLANTQFIENRVYDDSEETDQKPDAANNKKEDQAKTREQREAEVIPRVIKALNLGINVLDKAFEQLDANVDNSDSEDEDATYRAVEPILEPKDLYAHRSLPFLIGSPAFMQDDNVGVSDITEEEMSGEGSVSGSEKTATESESEYTEESETESEVESDIVAKQKKAAQQEKSGSESENDLFEGDEDSEEDNEKPKGGAFASELAAKIGAAPASKPEDEETKRDRTISEASATSTGSKGKKRKKGMGKDKAGKRRSASKTSAASEDNMFGEPEATAEDEESPFGRKGGLFSTSGGGLFGEEEKDEDEGGLFDEAPKPRSASHKDEHIYEDIGADDIEVRPRKGSKKLPAGAVPIFGEPSADANLFGSSPKSNEAGKTLFMRATSAAKERRSSMESSRKKKKQEAEKNAPRAADSSGGLFDDDDEEDGLFAAPAASKPKKEAAKKTVDLFDDDEEGDLFGEGPKEKAKATVTTEKTKKDSKKIPAGAVSMFGAVDPLAAKLASGHHKEEQPEQEKAVAPLVAKKDSKSSLKKASMFDNDKDEEGDLFAENSKSKPAPTKAPTRSSLFADSGDEEEGLFAGKETIHVPPAVKTPPAAKTPPAKPDNTKAAPSSSGLFDDIEGDDDEDLFASTSKPKEVTKKKPVGGVALFGDEDAFSTSPKKEPEIKAPVMKRDKAPKARTTLSLFDDDEQDEQLFGEADAAKKDEPITRHRSKSKSVFDDEDVLFNIKEEAPPVDLFGSASQVTAAKPDSKLDKPRSASSASKSLFSDEDEDDLFGSASKTTSKAQITPDTSTKPQASSKVDLFGDDNEEAGDDLFGGAKTKPSPPDVKAKSQSPPDVKAKSQSPPEVKAKSPPPVTKSKPAGPEVQSKPVKEKGVAIDGPAQSDPLFGDQSPPSTASKPKKPAGAVSMFGGFDPSAVTRQISSGSSKEEARDEEMVDDKRNRTPSTSSVSENISPKPFSPAMSTDKPVIRSVKAPTAKAGGKRISMLQSNIAIDPTAMRPGATPPSRETEPGGVSFDEPPKLQTLSSLNKGRAKISSKRRPPSRRLRTEGATTAISSSGSEPSSTSPGPLLEDKKPASDLPDISSSSLDTRDLSSVSPLDKPKAKNIPPSDLPDFNSPLGFAPSGITLPPAPSADEPKKKSPDMFGNDNLFSADLGPTVATASTLTQDKDDNLFATAPKKAGKPKKASPLDVDEDLFSSTKEAPENKTLAEPLGDDLFGEGSESKKQGKKSGKPKKAEKAPLMEDDDLFASAPSPKTKKTKEPKKNELDDDDDLFAPKKPTPKKTKSKKPDSDLFSDSTNIFEDIPSSKPKEKKKKKEADILTNRPEDDIFASPTSSKPKKTKTKKKTTDKKPVTGDSIFDESAPSVFDDPLNAMGK